MNWPCRRETESKQVKLLAPTERAERSTAGSREQEIVWESFVERKIRFVYPGAVPAQALQRLRRLPSLGIMVALSERTVLRGLTCYTAPWFIWDFFSSLPPSW